MGNPAWGHGYHKGFGDGAKQGGVVGALITMGAAGLVMGGKWAVRKLRERSVAKQLDAESATEPSGEDQNGTQMKSTD
ncbi:hypothetical protein [Yonghaparkia sp. Soil809]|uniref:hypothetical protein n=1 Tax=Yonghaparkia sp. Soil809 TaxID=1736417 RepID=UPI0012EAFF93|nr:hypothetical protein [Yonghaparkia sp. Soil809]